MRCYDKNRRKKSVKSYLKRMMTLSSVMLLPVVSYLILGPLEIYVGNTKDFPFVVADFLPAFCVIGIAGVIVLSALLASLPEKAGCVVQGVVLAGGICSYIQYMFMNTKLSEATGAPMDWDSLGIYPQINLLIWIVVAVAVIISAVLLKKKWDSFAVFVSLALCGVQAIAIITLLMSVPSSAEDQQYQAVGDQQFEVAAKDNVVVFVLDTFGNTVLDQVVVEHPEALAGMKDFEFYSNADCHYYCTFPSMTSMLTGIDFDFDMNSWDWLEQAWKSDKANRFFDSIHENGYSTYLYSSDYGYVYGGEDNLCGKFDNVIALEPQIDQKKLVGLMSKISAYRYLPYIVKPHFEVLTQEFQEVRFFDEHLTPVDDNAEFYRVLKENGLATNPIEEKAFIIQHLFGVHLPYTLTAEGEYTEESTSVDVATGLLRIVSEYVEEMKRLGVYDSSTIIVMADHGAWYGNDTQPVFFIKRKGQHQDAVITNRAPISLDDFQATILDCIGEDYSVFGKAVDDWHEEDERVRTVYMRGNNDEYPSVQGSSFNVYYGYTYSGDREDLQVSIENEKGEILSATPW